MIDFGAFGVVAVMPFGLVEIGRVSIADQFGRHPSKIFLSSPGVRITKGKRWLLNRAGAGRYSVVVVATPAHGAVLKLARLEAHGANIEFVPANIVFHFAYPLV